MPILQPTHTSSSAMPDIQAAYHIPQQVPPTTSSADAGPILTTREKQLQDFVKSVHDRLGFAQSLFEGSDFTPFTRKHFVTFLQDTMAEIVTRYAITGVVTVPSVVSALKEDVVGPTAKDREMTREGFVVGGGSIDKPTTNQTVDPALEALPAFQLAKEMGFDLLAVDDDGG